MSRTRGDYMASGHLGQYLYVDPATSVVIVRLGRSLGGLSHRQWRALLVEVAQQVASPRNRGAAPFDGRNLASHPIRQLQPFSDP